MNLNTVAAGKQKAGWLEETGRNKPGSRVKVREFMVFSRGTERQQPAVSQ